MRRAILLSLFVLFAVSAVNDACAQRYGGAGHGFAHRGHGSNRGRAVLPYGFGYADMPYGFDSRDNYAPQPVVVVQQPPAPVVQPPAPPADQPSEYLVIKEYKWPAAGKASSASAPSAISASNAQDFAIVLKDGTSLTAIAVFASDDGVHYVDADQRQMRVSMSEIDRVATIRVNRERNLNLQLPAAD